MSFSDPGIAPVKKFSFRNAPIAVPIIAAFHFLWLILRISQFASEPLTDLIWIQVLWIAVAAVSWLLIVRFKWAANVYIGLTVLNLILRFTLKDEHLRNALTDALFPIDLICSMLLLVLWKRIFRN